MSFIRHRSGMRSLFIGSALVALSAASFVAHAADSSTTASPPATPAIPSAQPDAQQPGAHPHAHKRQAPKLDTDGDGRVSRQEAQARPQLAAKFDQLDADKDGYLSRDEMRAGMKASAASAQAKWKAADRDGDGALTKAEAEQAGMTQLAKNFDRIDADHDGKVTSDEMRGFHRAHAQQRTNKAPAATQQ